MHRIGGIEKEDGTGNVNYDPENHELMTRIRADKVAGIANDIPPVDVDGDVDADVLVLGWGSTWGAISEAVRRVRAAGQQGRRTRTSCTSTRSPPTSARCCAAYPKVLVPEMNLGQLSRLVRAEFLVDAQSLTQGAGPARSARPRSKHKILEMIDA